MTPSARMFSPDPGALGPLPPHRAYGMPVAWARVRSRPEDFRVTEEPAFEPSGAGEHVVLEIQKRGSNTEWVARALARLAGVRPVDVGFAGLKDRWAVTRQWFSVRVAATGEPDWSALESADLKICQVRRHHRKLRRGALRGNRFELVLRQVEGDRPQLEQRLGAVAGGGVPNYFGEQRFGREGMNLSRAERLLCHGERVTRDRHKRGLYLSAARAALFNRVLGARVAEGLWNQGVDGDVMMLDGSRSVFVAEQVDAELRERVRCKDIHPTGPLWGRGGLQPRERAQALEREALEGMSCWCAGLEKAGCDAQRRPLRLVAVGLEWRWSDAETLELSFGLPAGGYATAVLRELIEPASGLEAHGHAGE